MEFLEKNKARGIRHARTAHVRIKRTHKKVVLDAERRIGPGAHAPGVLVPKGIRLDTPASPGWRDKRIEAAHAASDAESFALHAAANAEKKFKQWGLPEKAPSHASS